MSNTLLFLFHAGDSYEHDVKGANNAGLRSALLLRNILQPVSTVKLDVEPATVTKPVDGNEEKRHKELYGEADMILNTLMPSEFEKKVCEFAHDDLSAKKMHM